MKKYIAILIVIFTLTSCEDVVDVDVPEGTPRLVIDASFEFYLNEDPIAIDGYLRLTESAPFFDEVSPVNNATVFITNLSTNAIINFENSDNNGFYLPTETILNSIPEFEVDYELTVIYNNETYKAITQVYPSVPIENIEQGDGTLFEDETEIIVTFTDDESRDNFYLFDFDLNLIEVSEDRFYQGETFTFSYFYENMVGGENLTIKILGIDQRYHDYAQQIVELSDQGGGDPFQVPPTVVRGNIINTTNQDNFALGYFNLSEAYRFNFTIEEDN